MNNKKTNFEEIKILPMNNDKCQESKKFSGAPSNNQQ